MDVTKVEAHGTLQDSGLGSFGSESDSSPIQSASVPGAAGDGSSEGAGKAGGGGAAPTVTPTFRVDYLGQSQLDKRYTHAMYPWVMAEVKRNEKRQSVMLEVLPTSLRARDCEGNGILFEHELKNLFRFARMHRYTTCFAYLSCVNVKQAPFYCHVFESQAESNIPELFDAIREASKSAMKDHSGQMSLSREGRSVDSIEGLPGASLGGLFEVMYIGKVLVSDTKTKPSFIDEAVKKFQEYEETKAKTEKEEERKKNSAGLDTASVTRRHTSGASIRSLPSNLEHVSIKENELGSQAPRYNAFGGSTDSNISNSSNSSEHSNGSYDSTHRHLEPTSDDIGQYTIDGALRNNNQQIEDLNTVFHQTTNSDDIRNGSVNGQVKCNTISDGLESKFDSSGNFTKPIQHGLLHGRRNRTMLIQIGTQEVCLISTDKKSVILERQFKDISFCLKGIKNIEHFGFISREPGSQALICYVFRGASESVVEEILNTLKAAFNAAFAEESKNHVVCEYCPMHQFSKLCKQIEEYQVSSRRHQDSNYQSSHERAFEVLQKRVDNLPEKDHNDIMNKFKLANPQTPADQVEVMMSLLLHMCQAKQKEHTHISNTNRTQLNKFEFNLLNTAKYRATFDNLRCKAKRSLTDSFENLIRKRHGSGSDIPIRKDYNEQWGVRKRSHTNPPDLTKFEVPVNSKADVSPRSSPLPPEHPQTSVPKSPGKAKLKPAKPPPPKRSPSPARSPLIRRQRSSTLGTIPTREMPPEVQVTVTTGDQSPNSTRKEVLQPQGPGATGPTPMKTIFTRVNLRQSTPARSERTRKGSWRFDIFNRVVTPAKVSNNSQTSASTGQSLTGAGDAVIPHRDLTPEAIRALWKKAILETLLLIRMEKENISLQARQDAAEMKRMKLDYKEIVPCLKDVTREWEALLRTPDRANCKFELKEYVKQGIPQSKRGEIWELLVEQHRHHRPEVYKQTPPAENYDTPYEELLRQLTTHQHAILIDLGRTFPNHPYFSRELGAGQLSLFNLLKAYSLIDTEVGYCQGLSFVAGILLMHMQEEAAFETLKHMLFRLNFRRQYRPDMAQLQIQMYQLSRLLHDMHKDLDDHFAAHEIGPTLYAAPWFLTIFASEFPLGFVSRVFDLILLFGMEVVFKVALVLLGNHKELIKQEDSLESIVKFLKTTLPEMGTIQMERVIAQVFTMDISRQLAAYEVEYHVFQEEVANPIPSDTMALQQLETANQTLRQQNMELAEQLATTQSNEHSLMSKITTLNSDIEKLRAHMRTLELERAALLNAVTQLRAGVPDSELEIPEISTDGINSNSPIHNPILNRLVESKDLKLRSGASLTELDKELLSQRSKKATSQLNQAENERSS